jgi:signal transduction histidine kinase
MVFVIALVLYDAFNNLLQEDRKQAIAVALVRSIFERTTLRSEYLSHYEERSKLQWQAKREEVANLLDQADRIFDERDKKAVLTEMRRDLESGVPIFLDIVGNHEKLVRGERPAALARDVEDRLVAQLLIRASNLISNAVTLQEASAASLAAAQKRTIWLMIVLVGIMVVSVSVNTLSINRIITRKIDKLREGTRIIGEGNLDYRIETEGQDELSELSHAFNDSSEKLKRRSIQLEAANGELDSFAYAVSHDLRAPLRAMTGFSQALVEDYGASLHGEARTYLDQIILASRRMSDLLEGLLTLSRSTRDELRRDRIDLSGLAGQILADLAKAEPERQVEWRIEPGLIAQGDKRMIEVVMRNLLANAWKFTAHTTKPLVCVYAEEKEGERFFCVADNGAGFDMKHIGNLFKPFQRLHRQEEFPGTSIGMATVQRILNRHGGIIYAVAAPGEGATFYFSLPEAEEEGRHREKQEVIIGGRQSAGRNADPARPA